MDVEMQVHVKEDKLQNIEKKEQTASVEEIQHQMLAGLSQRES